MFITNTDPNNSIDIHIVYLCRWLHSYIMYLNENEDVVYMIHAIISRLKREHKESNINIKQVINTVNNNYQVDSENIPRFCKMIRLCTSSFRKLDILATLNQIYNSLENTLKFINICVYFFYRFNYHNVKLIVNSVFLRRQCIWPQS